MKGIYLCIDRALQFELLVEANSFHLLHFLLREGHHKLDCRIGVIPPSLVSSPRAPPGEKQSGEQSRISWAYYTKAVRTNEIARSVIIT